jgi:SAM-dependent methyltransferase
VSGSERTWVDDMARAYQRWMVPAVFLPFAVDLAARVIALEPATVLEVAAGTGVLTGELVNAGIPVVATDLNDAMVSTGRELVPSATWRQADAMALPFDDGEFDVVACQFGAMFFPDKPRAFAEARRVLASRGTFMFSSWDTIDTHGWEKVLDDVLQAMFPTDPPDFFRAFPHGYADPERIAADVRAGGFSVADVETVTVQGSTDSVADLVTGYCTGSPVRAQLEARGDLEEATATARERMVAVLGDGPTTVRMSAHVVTAKR